MFDELRIKINEFSFEEWVFEPESPLKGSIRLILCVFVFAAALMGAIFGMIKAIESYPWITAVVLVILFLWLCYWAFRSDR